jgi:predicted RNA methylase
MCLLFFEKNSKTVRDLEREKMNAKEKLDLIKRNAGHLVVNVTAQGMAFAEFLDSIGIHTHRARIVKKRIIFLKGKTVVEWPRI